MVRLNNYPVGAMEFTSFQKKPEVNDDQFLTEALKFEKILSEQKGVVFHCIVRNLKNEYANVLFTEKKEELHRIGKDLMVLESVQEYLSLIDMSTVKLTYHEILKSNFVIPQGFSCIEHGTFYLKNGESTENLLHLSSQLEKGYLDKFENSLAHFIGKVEDNKFSEVSIGKTYASTKKNCYGYFDDEYGAAFLDLAQMETVDLDFWYLIA